MGRKDATSVGSGNISKRDAKVLPVDSYRRKIGKQDYQKSKKEIHGLKTQKEAKESAMKIWDVVLMLVVFLGVIGGIYLVLYISLSNHGDTVNTGEPMSKK